MSKPNAKCNRCDWEGNDGDTWTIEGQMCCPECREPVELLEESEVSEAELEAALEELKAEFELLMAGTPDDVLEDFLEENKPEVTDWFPKDIKPVRKGVYEVIDEPNWPFVSCAEWNGEEWNNPTVSEWRGLANEPIEV